MGDEDLELRLFFEWELSRGRRKDHHVQSTFQLRWRNCGRTKVDAEVLAKALREGQEKRHARIMAEAVSVRRTYTAVQAFHFILLMWKV